MLIKSANYVRMKMLKNVNFVRIEFFCKKMKIILLKKVYKHFVSRPKYGKKIIFCRKMIIENGSKIREKKLG